MCSLDLIVCTLQRCLRNALLATCQSITAWHDVNSVFSSSNGNNLHFLLLHFPLRAEIFNFQLLARARKAFKAIIGSTLKANRWRNRRLHSSPGAFLASFSPEGIDCAIEMPTKFHAAKSNTPPEEVTHKHKSRQCDVMQARTTCLLGKKSICWLYCRHSQKRPGLESGVSSSTLKLSGCLSVRRCGGVCEQAYANCDTLCKSYRFRRTEIHCCRCTKSRWKSARERVLQRRKSSGWRRNLQDYKRNVQIMSCQINLAWYSHTMAAFCCSLAAQPDGNKFAAQGEQWWLGLGSKLK